MYQYIFPNILSLSRLYGRHFRHLFRFPVCRGQR